MHLGDRFDGVQVVDTLRRSETSSTSTNEYTYRVQTDLVHDRDTSLLALLVQLHHGRRDVRRRHDILLGADGRLDDQRVEGVGDQGDGQVILLKNLVQRIGVVDVEGNRLGVLETFAQFPGALEGSAGC